MIDCKEYKENLKQKYLLLNFSILVIGLINKNNANNENSDLYVCVHVYKFVYVKVRYLMFYEEIFKKYKVDHKGK